jgi:hypothetical protein
MHLSAVPRLHRRTVVLYLLTIVLPGVVFLWLGIRAFEDKRDALIALRTLAVENALNERTLDEARKALDDPHHSIVDYTFVFEDGKLVDPVMDEPLPDPPPPEFVEAYRQQSDHPAAALALFEQLRKTRPALALQGIAQSLNALGRKDDARSAWKTLAASYPDERDLSRQPFGLVAALAAGETAGLYEQIERGRWRLSYEQARNALDEIAPERPSRYLQRFAFGRALADFRPPLSLSDREPREATIGKTRLFLSERRMA